MKRNRQPTRFINSKMNRQMWEAISDSKRGDRFFFDPDTMDFWNCVVEAGLFPNNTFVTSEDNYDRSKTLYTVRHYDWEAHSITTIGEFLQFHTVEEAILFAKSYKE